jgi:hypothetical protein
MYLSLKSFTTVLTLLRSVLAAPASSSLESRAFFQKANSRANPAQPNGKLYWAVVTPNDMCTIFNLELVSSAVQGKICNLVFDFPSLAQAPALFGYSESGHFTFTGYDINAGAGPGETGYNNQPRPDPSPS